MGFDQGRKLGLWEGGTPRTSLHIEVKLTVQKAPGPLEFLRGQEKDTNSKKIVLVLSHATPEQQSVAKLYCSVSRL